MSLERPIQLADAALCRLGLRGFLALFGLALALLLCAGTGPWSPWALDRTDSLVASGHSQSALVWCDWVGRLSPWVRTRDEARYRSALLRTSLLGDHQGAVGTLRALLRREDLPSAERKRALILLADLLRSRIEAPKRAARRFHQLAALVAGTPEEASWLLEEARALEGAGQTAKAQHLRSQVAERGGPQAIEAQLDLGRVRLGQGNPARAYNDYQAALELAVEPGQRRLARLGMAMALDELGQTSLAVAELDEAAPAGDAAIDITRQRVLRRAGEQNQP